MPYETKETSLKVLQYPLQNIQLEKAFKVIAIFFFCEESRAAYTKGGTM